MAPDANLAIVYQALIHSNCLTFLGPEAELEVISQLAPSGNWKVHVLKLEHGRRSAVLSEAADTLARAFELLHAKSAQAVDQYVRTNGFGMPPDITMRPCRHPGRQSTRRCRTATDIEQSEMISVHSAGHSSATETSDTDGSLQARNRSRRQKAVSSRVPRLELSPPVPPHLPPPPPPPPLLPPHGLPAYPKAPGGQGLNRHVPPPPPPPGAVVAPRAPPKKVAARLNIQWVGHGEKKVLVQCWPLDTDIVTRALEEVHMAPHSFGRAASGVMARTSATFGVIKHVWLGDESYELRSFGGDLSSLFGGAVPRFDVEVRGPPRPPPPGRPGPVPDSDCSGSETSD